MIYIRIVTVILTEVSQNFVRTLNNWQ